MAVFPVKIRDGSGANAELTAPASTFAQGERSLKFEERIVQLFDELRVPVFRYLLCMGVSPEEADEITQETFLRLCKHLYASGPEDNLRGWVFRVARNIALDHYKLRRWTTSTDSDEVSALGGTTVDPAPNPEQLLLQKERLAKLRGAISTLSHHQLECIHLRLEGFRYREIADILGISVNTVAEYLRRAISKLTKEFNG
jgi:RNA polymerase sigma-70 factor (ECF subfamily)